MGKRSRRKVVGRRFGVFYEKVEVERARKGTVEEFPNLGLKVEWVDGKVIVYRNGNKEVYENFSELRVPSRTVKMPTNEKLPDPSAVYAESNGVKYYLFPELGVIVKSTLMYWDSEVHPPEHLFGRAGENEFAKALLRTIKDGKWVKRAEAIAKSEMKWKEMTKKAVERAIRILAKRYGCDVVPPELQPIVEELRERGFEVKVKVR